jgi:hypothetical protein
LYIVPTIIACLVFFTPEIPRWLLKNGKVEQARASLTEYREGKFSQDKTDSEFRELEFALKHEVEKGSCVEVSKGLSFKRTLLVLAINFFNKQLARPLPVNMEPSSRFYCTKAPALGLSLTTAGVKSLGTINPFDMKLDLDGINVVSIMIMLLIDATFQTMALITM